MKSLILKSGWWLTGEAERRSVSRHLEGTDVIGYVVQGSDARWRIEGRNDQFDSPTLAADALVEDRKS
jgi:hypothetical protein